MPERDEGSWDELARELGVDAPSSPPADSEAEPEPQPPPLPRGVRAEIPSDDGFAEGLASADEAEDGDDEGDESAEGEGEAGTEEGQPGTGRKRRRRRRRRKKGGADAAAPGTTVAADEEAGVVSAVPAEVDDRLETESDEFAPDPEAEDDEADVLQPVGEEDTGSEVLRELISTWNVPAWDDIIAGLYRPDR